MCLGSPPPFSFSFKFSEALYSNSRRSSRDMCHIDNKSIRRSHDSDGVQVNSSWTPSNSFLKRGGPRDRGTLIQYEHAGNSRISHPIFPFEVPRGGPRKSSFHWYDVLDWSTIWRGGAAKAESFSATSDEGRGDQALLNCTHKLFFLFVENSLTCRNRHRTHQTPKFTLDKGFLHPPLRFSHF
jgi:hypothetical protein